MPTKGRVEKVYSLTPFGQEMAALMKKFEHRVATKTLQDVRIALISQHARIKDEIWNVDGQIGAESALEKAIAMVARKKREATR